MVAAQSVAHVVVTLGENLDFGQSNSVFDLDRSNGIPDGVSTLVIVAAALGAVVLASEDRSGRLPAAGLAVALLVVGANDTLHTGSQGTSSYALVVIGTLLAAVALTTWVALGAHGVARTCLLVGLVLLVLDVRAPFVYDQLMNTVGQPWVHRGDFLYELGVVLDEGMELMGWVLVAAGLGEAALAVRTTTSKTRTDIGLDFGHRQGEVHVDADKLTGHWQPSSVIEVAVGGQTVIRPPEDAG